jgi:hypothetical protein
VCLTLANDVFSRRGWGFIGELSILSCMVGGPNALSGLHTLVHELAVNSGVDTSLTNWVDSVFGRWKSVMITVLWATFTCVTVLVLGGCV